LPVARTETETVAQKHGLKVGGKKGWESWKMGGENGAALEQMANHSTQTRTM